MSRTKFSLRYWTVLAVLLVSWLTVAHWLVPAIIRDAYAGESLAFLNRIISGQLYYPVEEYLDIWRRWTTKATLVFSGLGLVTYVTILIREQLEKLLMISSPVVARWALVVVIFLAMLGHLYQIDAPLYGWHAFRQLDTAAIARNFYDGPFNVFYPQVDWRGNSPGYVEVEFQIFNAMVAVLYRIFGPHEWLARSLNTLFYAASAILLYFFTRRIFNEGAAVYAVIFYSLAPLVFFYSSSFQAEALLTLCSISSIYFFWSWTETDRRAHLAIAAVATTVALLIKPPILYLAIPLGFLAYQRFKLGFARQKVLWLFAVIVILPVGLWYTHAYSLWVTYGNTFGLFGRQTIAGVWPIGDPHWASLFQNVMSTIVFELATPAGIPLLIAGIVLSKRKRTGILLAWMVGFALYVILVPKGHRGHNYYQLQIAFVVAAYIGYGASQLIKRNYIRTQFVGLLIVCAVVLAAWQLEGAIRIKKADWDRIEFGRRVKTVTKPTDLVIFAVPLLDAASSIQDKPYLYRHRTAQGEFLFCDPTDFYYSRRKGWSIDELQATPEFLEKLASRGARYFATFFPTIFNRHPDLFSRLESTYTRVDFTDRWAIYRLNNSGGAHSSEAEEIKQNINTYIKGNDAGSFTYSN